MPASLSIILDEDDPAVCFHCLLVAVKRFFCCGCRNVVSGSKSSTSSSDECSGTSSISRWTYESKLDSVKHIWT